jgi:hypothetical protein
MKKILIIIIISILIIPNVYATTDNSLITFGQEKSVVISQDQNNSLYLVYTYRTLNTFFNIDIMAVEATVVINTSKYDYDYLKVVIEKDKTEYIYNAINEIERFPLQMGTGKYKISILGSTDGRRFRQLKSETFNVEVEENVVFLSSTQTVSWDSESEVTILASILVDEVESDLEKLELIHNYIVHNVSYDYEKATSLPKGYIPDPLTTLEDKKGICYDFAALLGAMLRSQEVPTKLIKGYSTYTPVYHAWNEVLVEDEWYIVDTSTDSIFVEYDVSYVLRKSEKDYKTSKEY